MSDSVEKQLIDNCKSSLERIQNYDCNQLIREKELGSALAFEEVIEYANKLIGLYKQISLNVLEDLPSNKLEQLMSRSNSDYTYFEEILKFSPQQANPHQVRQGLINKIKNAYQPTFDILHPIISYSTSKSADFKRLESEARSMIQSVKDHANVLNKDLIKIKDEANQILDDIRKVAAEQGVSQQAIFFKQVSEDHERSATNWQKSTIWLSVILGLYAIASIFIHKIPILKPETPQDAIQLAVSKVLIFAVMTYMLYLSAKNFIANKHNAIINKHRQTALMTYKALVDAAQNTDNKEIILTHASACIFSPQNTGFGKDMGSSSPTAKSVVELLTKPFSVSTD